jgi:hypothetical protein
VTTTAAGTNSRRPGSAKARNRGRVGAYPPLQIDPADTLGEQQSFDAVKMCSPLMDQIVTLAVRARQIFFIDTRNPHYRPDVTVASKPRDQRAQQLADVDAIRLCPAESTTRHSMPRALKIALARTTS